MTRIGPTCGFLSLFLWTFSFICLRYTPGVHKCVWVLSMELTPCHFSFVCIYEVAPRFVWKLCNPDIRHYFRSYFQLEAAFALTSTRNIHLQYLILTFVYKRSEKCVNTVYRMRDTACGLVVVVLQVSWLLGRFYSLLCCMLLQSFSAQVLRPPFLLVFIWRILSTGLFPVQ